MNYDDKKYFWLAIIVILATSWLAILRSYFAFKELNMSFIDYLLLGLK